MDPRLKGVKIEAACDVDNPLVGMQGASFIFGRQKGANVEMMKELDENLQHYANMLKRYVSFDVSEIPGAGGSGRNGSGCYFSVKGRLAEGH